ncbi:hypothetical protein ACQPYK_22165 [Streptosporangium sp. CA-135522]|uniref:hypothetical protein n=1 Tax=Streptosporangium sp. CA-135522 TaxID=3240072 RepID=UPI003D8ABC26
MLEIYQRLVDLVGPEQAHAIWTALIEHAQFWATLQCAGTDTLPDQAWLHLDDIPADLHAAIRQILIDALHAAD